MDIFFWVVFGTLAGWISSLIMGTGKLHDTVAHIAAGVCGAILGGQLAHGFISTGLNGPDVISIVTAILGAAAVITVLVLTGRTKWEKLRRKE
jgi:uncharacterized membrane protein YeaQ/YmgE (transglycosylase-associated protein family)